ncbi:MAG TPA: (2Fe-2S)-binding protein [Chthonomonadaceae bacterium]|nr:(2Fe-2S)-binding protein [Chthonomonadaceae bacterium]
MPNKQDLKINGSLHTIQADPERSLLGVLRDDLDLTGTKYGCGEGQCAACTVLIDGQPAPSCITPVGSVIGRQIVTIEGLEKDGKLHPVQEAFLAEDALQCAYCTPGMILGAAALLQENPNPSDAEIAQAMQNHICRCGTYPRILRAVRKAAQMQTSRRSSR